MNKVLYFFLSLFIYHSCIVAIGSYAYTLLDFILATVFCGFINNICGYIIYRKKYKKNFNKILRKYSYDHFLFKLCQLTGTLAIVSLAWCIFFSDHIIYGAPSKSNILTIGVLIFLFLPSPLKIVRAKQYEYYNKNAK